jgi:hypothetical protein
VPVWERLRRRAGPTGPRDAPTEHGVGGGEEQGRVAAESQRGGAGGDPEGGARHGRLRFEGAGGGLSAQSTSRRDGSDRARREG